MIQLESKSRKQTKHTEQNGTDHVALTGLLLLRNANTLSKHVNESYDLFRISIKWQIYCISGVLPVILQRYYHSISNESLHTNGWIMISYLTCQNCRSQPA